jgi:16S rRNA G1207 methylase RsmC
MTESPAGNTEHYFSAQPAGEFASTVIPVYLAGRELELETAGSVFSPDHVDGGTDVLLRAVDALPETGTFLDIGCGWGPIALSMALESPAAAVYAIDVNQRALELTRRNTVRAGVENVVVATPDEVPENVEFDVIWSNPPIRVGKAELHAIMNQWLPRLRVGGEAWMVVAKHLGADSFEKWIASEFAETHSLERASNHKGFRVFRVFRDS